MSEIRKELRLFRALTGFLIFSGLSQARAELWARAAVERYRHARRHGLDAQHLFNRQSADTYAMRDALGFDPRKWI